MWNHRQASVETKTSPQATTRQGDRSTSTDDTAAMPPSAASQFVEGEQPTLVFHGEDLDSWVKDLATRTRNGADAPVDVTMPDGKKFRLAVKPDASGNGIMGEVLSPSPGNFTFSTRPETGAVSFGVLVAKEAGEMGNTPES